MTTPQNPEQALTERERGQFGPMQTDFNATFGNELDYPRLGNVTFRRGTLTDNQQALFDEHWPRLGRDLANERIDIDE